VNIAGRVAVLLFAVAWGANHFVPLLPVYRAVLTLAPAEVAQIFGIYALGLMPGLLLGGPLSDRWGRPRLVMPAAVVAFLGSVILGGFRPTFSQLLAGRFVVGLGSGIVFSAATAWVQDLAGASGARGTGARRAAVALSLGFGGGPLIAGILAQWGPWPLHLPYAVQGAILVIAWLSAWLAVGASLRPQPSSRAPSRLVDAVEPAPVWPLPAGFYGQILPAAPWVFALPSISFAVLPAALAPALGAYTAVFAGGIAAVTLLAGVLVQRPLRLVSPRIAARVGTGCGAFGLFVAVAALWAEQGVASIVGVVVAAMILGAGYGGCLVAGLRFIELRSPASARGAHTGIFYVLAYAGFVAPLVLAWLGRRWGTPGALTWAAACATTSVLLLFTTKRRERDDDEER
jgi:hypothetical protein